MMHKQLRKRLMLGTRRNGKSQKIVEVLRRRGIGPVRVEPKSAFNFWQDVQLNFGNAPLCEDLDCAPCGHPTEFSKFENTARLEYCSAVDKYKGPGPIHHRKVLTPAGYVDSDHCFCDANMLECRKCQPILFLLGKPELPREHDCMLDDPMGVLKAHKDFKVLEYEFDRSIREDGEGWADEEVTIKFFCIEYRGTMVHRKNWHLYTLAASCCRCWHYTCSGKIVQSLPCNPGRNFRVFGGLPYINFYTVDTVEDGVAPLEVIGAMHTIADDTLPPSVHERMLESAFKNFYLDNILMVPGLEHSEEVGAYNSEKGPLPDTIVATARMNQDSSVIERNASQDQKHNVDLVETTVPSTSKVASKDNSSTVPWLYDSVHKYPDLTDRWTKAFEFVWTTSQSQGDIIERFDLPLAAIHNFMNAPNALPWRQHAFYKTDMEIKILVNSQPAQSGILVVGSMYNAAAGTSTGNSVQDVSRVIQQPHVRVNAGASNSGVLKVPWLRHYPVGCILNNYFDAPMYYHTIFVSILAPLRSGPEGPTGVDVTIMVRFPNCEFYGQRNLREIGPTTATARMNVGGAIESTIGAAAPELGMLIKGVEGLLSNTSKPDCDRPQDVREPVNFYPQFNTSLSLGTGTNKVKLLQLHAENTTSHPNMFVPGDDQFSNKAITEIFGLGETFQWSTGQSSGSIIAGNIPVKPVKAFAPTYMGGNCQPTPMGMISSFYGGWYGNILMKVTFAISKFHSGRAYVVYNPDTSIVPDQVGALYAALIDIQDQSTYTFVIPYQSPAPFMPVWVTPRGANGVDSTPAPNVVAAATGHVSIIVENQLRAMQTASPTIDIIVEYAAGPNFGLVLPTGTLLRTITPRANVTATARMNVVPSDTGSDERLQTVTSSTAIGSGVPAWPIHLNETYDVRDLVKRYIPYVDIRGPDLIRVTSYSDFIQCAMANSYALVTILHAPLGPTGAGSPVTTVEARSFSADDTNTVRRITASTSLIARERVALRVNQSISVRVPYTSYAGMLSNGLDPVTRTNEMAAYSSGRLIVVVEFPFAGANESGTSGQWFEFDVQAGAAQIRDDNYIPDLVTSLHDGFRFVKSDFCYQIEISFREVWNTENPNPDTYSLVPHYRVYRAMGDNGNFYVFQGFPRVRGAVNHQFIQDGTTPSRSAPYQQSAVDEWNYSAAGQWVRDLSVDGDVEKNPGPEGSTEGASTSSQHTDSTSPPNNDGGASTIWGVLRMAAAVGTFLGHSTRRIFRWSGRLLRRLARYVPETAGGIMDRAGKLLQAAQAAMTLHDLTNRLRVSVDGFRTSSNESLRKIVERDPETLSKFVSHGIEYTALILNVWCSNSLGMTLLNIAALLSKLGIVSLGVSNFIEKFGLQARANTVEDNISNEYASLYITSILASIGVGTGIVAGEPFFKNFLKNVKDFFSTGFNVKRFLDSHFTVLREFVCWVKSCFGVESEAQVSDLPTDLATWVESVHKLTEVYNYPNILGDPRYALRVMSLQDQCMEFDKKFIMSKTRPPSVYSIYRSRLQRAIDALGKQGSLQKSKPTPFCIWMYGDSGTGKSHLTDELLVKVGHTYGVRTTDPIYTRSLDTEFWNGYNQQKLIAIHDFGKIVTGESYRKHVSEFSSLIEPTVFNPPQADLEDKKRIVDAQVVMVTSNHAFPDVQNIGMNQSVLFYRRRHCLVHARFNSSIVNHYRRRGVELEATMDGQRVYDPRKLRAEDLEKYGPYFHLEFGVHVAGHNKQAPVEYVPWSTFVERLVVMAEDHRVSELAACARRKEVYSRLAGSTPTGLEFEQEVLAESIARSPAYEEQPDWDEPELTATARMYAGVKLKPAQSPNVSNAIDDHRNQVLGGVGIRFERVTGMCEHKSRIEDQSLVVTQCEECLPKRPVVTMEDLNTYGEGESPNYNVWRDGHLPFKNELLQSRPLLVHLEHLIFGPPPDGYIDWEEISTCCCHNPEIYKFAYFDLVTRRGKTSIEVVIDMSNLVMPGSDVDANMFSGFRQCKVILPYQCGLTPLKHLRQFQARHLQGKNPLPDNFFCAGVQPRRMMCNMVKKPSIAFFTVHQGTMRTVIAGVHVHATSTEDQVGVLNDMIHLDPSSTAEIFNTFFFFKTEGEPRVKNYFSKVRRVVGYFTTAIRPILTWALVLSPLIALYFVIRKSSELQEAANARVSQSGDIRKTENTHPHKPTVVKATPIIVTARHSQKLGHISNSFVRVYKGTSNVLGVRLCNDYVLIPYHVTLSPGDFKVIIYRNGNESGEYTFEPGVVKVSRAAPYDLAVVKLPGVPAGRNIVNYFIEERHLNQVRYESELVALKGGTLMISSVNLSPREASIDYENVEVDGKRLVTTLCGYTIDQGHRVFECGTLLLSNDLLIGIYLADNRFQGIGYCGIVTKDMLQGLLSSLGATDIDMRISRSEPGVVEGEVGIPITEVNFIPIGKAPKAVTYSGKSNIEKSVIHARLSEPMRFPAKQRGELSGKSLGYDVVWTGCKKQFNQPKPIPVEECEKIEKYLIDQIVPTATPLVATGSEPLSVSEAILGVDGVPLLGSMKLNTAIGWPLMNEFPVGSKKFDVIKVSVDRTDVQMEARVYNDYIEANTGRRGGVCAPTVFMDFPKDELLKPGKDTRLINGAPIHHTIDMRRYLSEFFAAITKIVFKIAVGIDVHSPDWIEVHSGKDKVVDEDYSGFGPGFHSQWLDVIANLAVAWLKEHKKIEAEYECVVRCLFHELKNADHVAGDLVYQVASGSPSGAYATDRINSLANLCYHLLCYLRKHSTCNGFWSVYTLVYGDDTRRVEDAYTTEEFQECMASVGMKVTQNKSGRIGFLKREFVPFDWNGVSVFLAPLPRPIVGDIINWVRKPYFSKVGAVLESVDSYLSEIFHHGPSEYEKARIEVRKLLVEIGCRRLPEMPSFDDLFKNKYIRKGVFPTMNTSLTGIPVDVGSPTREGPTVAPNRVG